MKIIFCFSGQGSHYYRMAKELWEGNNTFRSQMQELDKIAADLTGISIAKEIYSQPVGKSAEFTRTLLTHPAIFMVEYSLAMVLRELGILPQYVLGTSLGEFTAAAVAGCLSPAESLKYVIHQARLLEETCPPGGMVAVLGPGSIYDNEPAINECVSLAGVNYHSHFVISGSNSGLKTVMEILKAKDLTYFQLPVSHGFHSSLIDAAAPAFLAEIASLKFQQPEIPLISCCHKKILQEIPVNYFWDIVRQPIAFTETIGQLEQTGDFHYIDAGASGTLATFLKYLLPADSQSQCHITLNQFGKNLTNLAKLKPLSNNCTVNQHMKQKERNMTAYVFPGQGAQKMGMGADLFDKFPEFTKKADAVLGYSIKELCLEDPQKVLGQTQYTQPALYTVCVLAYMAAVADTGIKPDFTAGHSLGEYAALFAAGVFDFETGLKIVKERGRLMSQASGGGMAAVIGLADADVQRILKDNNLASIDVANFNSPGQVVISGLKQDIGNAQSAFEQGGARMYVPLQVSGAFHSRYMEPAAREFAEFIRGFNLQPPQIPVIANVTARPYKKSELQKNLVEQIYNSVKWTESICYLMGKGVVDFKELGYGNVLTKLITKIKQEAQPLYVEDDEEEDQDTGAAVFVNTTPAGPAETSPSAETGQVDTTGSSGIAGDLQASPGRITAATLGSREFKQDYHLKYAYLSGAMYKGIASPELVVKMGKAGLMGFLGTGGMSLAWIEESIRFIQQHLTAGGTYGMNLLCNLNNPEFEEDTVELYLKYGITNLEAAAYMQITPALARYRLTGLKPAPGGGVETGHRVIGKVSRPEVAAAFLAPAPERLVNKLLEAGKVTREQADLAKKVPMADDICVEADSGGHTDMGVAYTLMPALLKLRDGMMTQYGYARKIRVGAAGGIGTPEAAAAAFILGADFIVTGSINQCTVEGGISDVVKDMLQQMNVQDTEYAPAGDMFELGAKVQVMRKGVFFPARANKLYSLYVQHNSLEEIDEKTRQQLEEKYFKRTFSEIWRDCEDFFAKNDPAQLERAKKSPKHRMALVFRWYFGLSTGLALKGDTSRKVDFQVQCGPALGAFNQWVMGTNLEDWHNRHVDDLAEKLMQATAELLNSRFKALSSQ